MRWRRCWNRRIFDTATPCDSRFLAQDRNQQAEIDEAEGWRALALNGAGYIVNPPATVAGLSQYLWKLEQPAAAMLTAPIAT